jgi:vitamin-K-epoxide reductase (warfarin-sensitive)
MPDRGLSRGDLLLMALLLSLAGIGDAAYLTWQWYAAASSTVCDISSYFSCSRVRESVYSAVGGIPTATVGLVGFAVLAVLAFLALGGRDHLGRFRTDRLLLTFASIGVAVGAVLSAIEVFVIEAICLLCLLGFLLDLGVLGLAVVLVRRRTAAPGV